MSAQTKTLKFALPICIIPTLSHPWEPTCHIELGREPPRWQGKHFQHSAKQEIPGDSLGNRITSSHLCWQTCNLWGSWDLDQLVCKLALLALLGPCTGCWWSFKWWPSSVIGKQLANLNPCQLHMFHIIWISAQHASVWMHLWWPNPHSVYHGRSKWFGDLSMQGLETRESRWNCSKGKSIGLCSNCPLTFSGYIRYKCEKNANISTNNSESFLHNVLLSTPSISPESSWRKKNLQNTLWVFFWSFYILYP